MKFIKDIFNRIKSKINSNITVKMFFITAVVLITFLTITLLSQRSLFETVYYKQKESDIRNNVKKFSDTFTNAQDEGEILSSIEYFQSQYNTSIAVLNTSTNIVVRFKTNSEVMDSKNNEIFSYVIRTIRGNNELVNKLVSSEQITLSFTDTTENVQSLASAVMKGNYIIIGITSVQQIKEAAGVISQFYKYFYIGAIILIFVMAAMYSKFITRPLRQINAVALKLSNLDFSEKCKVKNNDEIGNLGNTLNFLSDNLDNSLTSLNEANEKLKEDIDKERRIEAMRKEFIADVSHELKTPITLIKGYAEGIKDGVLLEETMDESLDVIIEESDKMGKLVKDMLQLSSLESKKEIFSLTRIDLYSLINKVVKRLSHSIEEKHIIINLNLLASMVEGDEFRIEQVITNFLTNAVRHCNKEGQINIFMEEDIDSIKIFFENTGSNIPEEDIDKIWDKFYKVDKSRSRKDGGTGLGLSIVKNILEMHQGSYGVKNTEDGVKFYFTLPKNQRGI